MTDSTPDPLTGEEIEVIRRAAAKGGDDAAWSHDTVNAILATLDRERAAHDVAIWEEGLLRAATRPSGDEALRAAFTRHLNDHAEDRGGHKCNELCASELDALATRPSGDEALLAHITTAFDEYLWGLSCSPGGEACEASVRYFRDGLLGELAALATPSSTPDAAAREPSGSEERT